MANPKHVAKLKEGWEAWNEWRKSSDEKPDLSGVELDGNSLDGDSLDSLDFYDLTDVNLARSKIQSVSFFGAGCSGASFERALISHARFHITQMRQCSFRDAVIRSTTFDRCRIEEVDFTYCAFDNNVFVRSPFQDVSGLDVIYHSSPSSIGIDTFFQSGGLPEAFLRGAGVPEEFIQYAMSLVGEPIEFYSCFLSYSSRDDEFARRLYESLQGRNVRTWFAPEELKIGDRFRSRIDESIRFHDKLVIILSANSVNSDWVETEVESALEREKKEGKDVLFPIAIDEEGFTSNQPWAADIRRKRHIGDFRKWKSHDDYTAAFDRLVRDLKKSQPPIIMKG
jgi:uncharacterized protein YjbI with pentapeptide repeats